MTSIALPSPRHRTPPNAAQPYLDKRTNGQVERMNRTIKEATVQAFHYASAIELKRHLHAFLLAYNCARRLKTLKGKTPYEFICQRWTI